MYNDFYSSNTMSSVMLIMGFGIFIFSFIIGLITIISYWKIYSKAGKPGWASIIPIYNNVVMLEIAKLPIWYLVLYFIPIVQLYPLFKVNIEIAKRFGKSSGYGIGMTLLGIIFIPMLAFSDSNYEGNASNESVSNNNVFDATSVINNNQEINNFNQVTEINVVNESIPTENIVPEVVEQIPVQENVVPEVEEQIHVQENIVPEVVEQVPVQDNIVPEVVEQIPVQDNVVPQVEENVPNAFNSTPIITDVENQNNVSETTSIEDITADTIINNISQGMDGIKRCKNCGNELPDIVSICPNCGTDNE